MYSTVFDPVNDAIYVGGGYNGPIYRCATSTGCDESKDWTTSIDTPGGSIISMLYDSTNDVIYAGTNEEGIFYRCDTSTGCDAEGDWTTSDYTGDYAYYRTIDVSDGSLGTQRTVDDSLAIGSTTTRMGMTKTVSDNLMFALVTNNQLRTYKSTDSGENWTKRADLFETTGVLDQILMFPADTGDDNDAVALYLDISANQLDIKMYDDSDTASGSWTTTNISGTFYDSTYILMDGAIRHSDNHLLVATHTDDDHPEDDLKTYDITVDSISSPTITAKTNIFTDQNESARAAMMINQQNDDVYVSYLKGGTWGATVDAVYHKSDDGMDTWGSESAYSQEAPDDIVLLKGGRTIGDDGGFIQWSFFNRDLYDIFVNTNNDIAIAAVGGVAGVSGIPINMNTGGTGSFIINGVLTVSKTGDTASTSLNVGSRTWTLANPNSAVPIDTSGAGGVITASVSTFEFTGDNDSGDVTIEDLSYYNLTLGGSIAENYDPAAAFTVTNDLTVNENGTLVNTVGSDDITVNGNVTGAGTVTLTTGTFEQAASTSKNFGSSSGSNNWTFYNLKFNNLDTSSGYTITPNAGTGSIIVTNMLTIGDSGTQVITFDNETSNDRTLDIDGSITIDTQGVLSGSSTETFTIADDFTNNGTFTPNTGTVTFDSTTTSTIAGSTPNTFYNFTSSIAGKELQFKATASTSFSGTLTLIGTNGNPLQVSSDTGGSQWKIYLTGSTSTTRLRIIDSGCWAGTSSINMTQSDLDGGNNDSCWSFILRGGGGPTESSSGGGTPVSGGDEGGGGSVEDGSGGGDEVGGGDEGGGEASP